MIPYGRQNISEADIRAVVDILRSDFLTQGPAVPAFENRVASHCGSKYAVAVNSATSALHLACIALGVGPGDVVWTSPVTFVASANCALYCGATVDFVDIDSRTYNLSAASLEQKLIRADRDGVLPKVVIPVHHSGQPCEMVAIWKLSQKYGFKIIEDASHAIGGRYRGQPIGDCRYSDVIVFSFHPVKTITCGEGGVAVTNDAGLADRMTLLRSHGITRDASRMTHAPDGPWYYQQIDLGFNYRMTDLQAALGRSQIDRLEEFVATRHEIARRYDELLAGLPLTTPWQHPDGYSGLHLYVVRLKLEQLQRSRAQVFDSLKSKGVGANVHYIPVYLQPFYEGLGFRAGHCPEAEHFYQEAVSLPMFPALTPQQQQHVVAALRSALQTR